MAFAHRPQAEDESKIPMRSGSFGRGAEQSKD